MRVSKHHVELARRVEKIDGFSIVLDDGRHVRLGDLPLNEYGQTPNEQLSYTRCLAHLISTSGGSFVTAATEEALSYLDEHHVDAWAAEVRAACERAGVEISDELYALLSRQVHNGDGRS